MRNILLLQLETKVALAIIFIVIAIFLFTIFKSIHSFNRFIERNSQIYEETHVK